MDILIRVAFCIWMSPLLAIPITLDAYALYRLQVYTGTGKLECQRLLNKGESDRNRYMI